jgi:hypothetical protein
MLLALVILLASIPPVDGTSVPGRPSWIEAQEYTNGPFGDAWTVRIDAGGAGAVRFHERTGKYREQQFALTAAQVNSIRQEIDAARFAELPETLAPQLVFLDGPEQRLYILSAGKVYRVFLLEPKQASGAEVERFRKVWRAVVACIPIPPPE